MWIAYAIPKEDFHLVVEDGIHFVAIGTTQEEATQNLLRRFADEHAEDNKRSVELGFDPEPALVPEEHYVIHTDKVK